MTILRYLTREILATTTGIGFCLFLLFFGYRFKKYLDQTANGEIAASAIAIILSYRIPDIMVLILPVAYFLGILVAYGRLYSDNEMVVLSSGSVSPIRLLGHTMLSAVVIAVLVGLLTIVVSPYTVNKVEEIKVEQANRGFLELLYPGRLQQESEESPQTYYFQSFNDDGKTIENVFFADLMRDDEGKEIPVLITAKSAQEIESPASGYRYLELNNGHQYVGQAGELEFQISHFNRTGNLTQAQLEEDIRRKYFERLPTKDLWGESHPKMQAELQWRLSIPIFVLVLALIAVPMSYTSPRRGRYAKILPAFIPTVLYLGLLIVMKGKVSDGDFPTQVGLWWVHGVFLLLAIVLLIWNNGQPLGKWSRSRKKTIEVNA